MNTKPITELYVSEYATIEVLPDGNLKLTATDAAREEAYWFQYLQEANALWELTEGIICNSALEWIQPEEIGALTDSPIIGQRFCEGDTFKYGRIWWAPNYAVEDIIALVLDAGYIFTLAEVGEVADEK